MKGLERKEMEGCQPIQFWKENAFNLSIYVVFSFQN